MTQQIIIADSTQLTCFDECPVRWYYRYCKQISKTEIPLKDYEGEDKKEKQNTRDMGTVFHKILEFRYRDKYGIRRCISEALDFYINGDEVDLSSKEIDLVGQTALIYDANYSINGDFFIKSPESVEVGFSECIYEDENYKFILEGRIDLAEAYLGGPEGVKVSVDHKSQGRAHRLYQKCIQFRNYAMVLDAKMFVVNYIRFNKNITKDTFVREIIPFSAAEHRSWKNEITQLYRKMTDTKLSLDYIENLHGNNHELINSIKRRSSCPSQYGGLCEFIPLCDETNPNIVINIMNQNYEHKEPFKPW